MVEAWTVEASPRLLGRLVVVAPVALVVSQFVDYHRQFAAVELDSVTLRHYLPGCPAWPDRTWS
ncbi:MAG: hypothetical protein HC914_16760 [Chloroflexaceae bacterium]|nr:hypothetical protein [Chloroflexaceae bacterium]